MQLSVEWARPIRLEDAEDDRMLFTFDPWKVPAKAGLYIFGRMFGSSFEALYVGKADNLQQRTFQQLNNLKLMMHISNAKAGKKVVVVGTFKATQGQQARKCLPILEKALIRHFLSEGNDLSNIQGTRLNRHEITSSGFKHVPKRVFVDRGASPKQN